MNIPKGWSEVVNIKKKIINAKAEWKKWGKDKQLSAQYYTENYKLEPH